MTLSSTSLIERAAEFAARGNAVDERLDLVILRGTFASAEEQAEWLALRTADIAPFVSLSVRDREMMDSEIAAYEAFEADREVAITIVKASVLRTATFMFEASAASYLETQRDCGLVRVVGLDSRKAFQTRGLDVGPWNLAAELDPPNGTIPLNPRKLVRDYVPEREIVDDLSPWIVTQRPALDSDLFIAWRNQAGRRLLGALVNNASRDEGLVTLQVTGPPITRFNACAKTLPRAWEELTDCVRWVYLDGADIEVRHVLFAAELARADKAYRRFEDTIRHALEGAQAGYHAHIQSSSRETLKALGDLRKTVIDETQKVAQRAQDLTGNLWRDLAVSASPFVLKVFVDASKTADTRIAAGFYFAAGVFIVLSYGFQCSINASILTNQAAARESWLQVLYGHISASEREKIADTPVRAAVKSYETTRDAVGAVYALLALLLFCFGIATLGEGALPAAGAPGDAPSASPVLRVSAPVVTDETTGSASDNGGEAQ